MPAVLDVPAVATLMGEFDGGVDVVLEPTPDPADAPPTPVINAEEMRALAATLDRLFQQYVSDRQGAEQRWLRNLRQFLGVYDSEIASTMKAGRSQAYPRVTRVKCISVIARIMNLMFPGNERHWELQASPSAEMAPEDVMAAVEQTLAKQKAAGLPEEITDELVLAAVQQLAETRAAALSTVIDDQLQEIGGDQTRDFIGINQQVVQSGVLYGMGVMRGPFVRETQRTVWELDPITRQPTARSETAYKPLFEVTNIWDFYPDMSAKTLDGMDGYFLRVVMSKAQLRDLARRSDFMADAITTYLRDHPDGNYKAQSYEGELRTMGVAANVSAEKSATGKFELIVWHGPIDGEKLRAAGVVVDDALVANDIESEIWMLDRRIIKADMNPWRKLGMAVKTIHTFLFDEDDTSPVGVGLPAVMRDSQLSVCAATRMLLDNASVVCGPNLELNLSLLMAGQDFSGTHAYKTWYRDDDGPSAQIPAIRNIQIDGHLAELQQLIDLFMRFADMETFVGPQTGGDMDPKSSEPMRTAAGQSMVHGHNALPFKNIIRHHDRFTQSAILALVQFNRKFNADRAPAGDYNVIARGATSLIAKEVRGLQIDQLAQTLTPEERMHIDERKFITQRFASRDLQGLLLSPSEATRRQEAAAQTAQQQMELQTQMLKAEIKATMTDAIKNIAQAQKNSAGADATHIKSGTELLQAATEPVAPEAPAKKPAAKKAAR